VEVDPELVAELHVMTFETRQGDFLAMPPRSWFAGKDFMFHTVGGQHDPALRGHTQGEQSDPLPLFMKPHLCHQCDTGAAVLFDVVVMNPRFSKGADAKHVLHAWKFVRPGGVLGAIVSPTALTRSTKVAKEFQAIHSSHGEYEWPVEAGAFKESGTMVATLMVVWRKPANENAASDDATAVG
jgi:hypothetical protein